MYKNEAFLPPPPRLFETITSIRQPIIQQSRSRQGPLYNICQPKMRHLNTSMLLALSTTWAVTLALPAPPTTLVHTLPQALRSDAHCGMVACPGGTRAGHAFCERLGCDFCVIIPSSPPVERWECDGMGRGAGGVSLVDVGKGNASHPAAAIYHHQVKNDE